MTVAKAPLLLRIYASGLALPPERRDELWDAASGIVANYERTRDREIAASTMAYLSRDMSELRLLTRAVDKVLKKDYRAPYKSRAEITTWLLLRASQIVEAAK